ncbi:MAG: alpha/beta hydrolase [Bacteroidales bacterium]|nr:alpha/beta hydrolase [Bacteroidales bacterium]
MFSSEESVVSVSGKEVFIRTIIPAGNNGNGAYLIFLHEGLGSITQWKDFPERIAEECNVNVLLYDRPGYGRSASSQNVRQRGYLHLEAEFLTQLIQELSLKQYSLLGHSEGGSIALIQASYHPDGLQRVITLAANTRFEDKMLSTIREAELVYGQAGSKLKQALEKHHGSKTDSMFYAWSRIWTAPFFREWNIKNELKKVTVPLLAIHGENDPYSSSLQTDLIKECTSSAQIVRIQQCSHHPHFDHPGKVTALICDFLKSS